MNGFGTPEIVSSANLGVLYCGVFLVFVLALGGCSLGLIGVCIFVRFLLPLFSLKGRMRNKFCRFKKKKQDNKSRLLLCMQLQLQHRDDTLSNFDTIEKTRKIMWL
jgi:hypothetical protein